MKIHTSSIIDKHASIGEKEILKKFSYSLTSSRLRVAKFTRRKFTRRLNRLANP